MRRDPRIIARRNWIHIKTAPGHACTIQISDGPNTSAELL